MTENYKLCPKCNNALDLNVSSCPYCWELMWMPFWWNQIKQGKRQNMETKKLSGLVKLIMVFFIVPIIISIISSIFSLIIEMLDNL